MGAMLLCRGARRSSRLASVYVAMTRKFDSACSQWHGVAELMTMCRPGEAWAAVLVLGRGRPCWTDWRLAAQRSADCGRVGVRGPPLCEGPLCRKWVGRDGVNRFGYATAGGQR